MNILYTDEGHINHVIDKVIELATERNDLNVFRCDSWIDEANVDKLIKLTENNHLIQKFEKIRLELWRLSYFNLCDYFRCFGSVWVSIYDQPSMDDLISLFKNCMYCNDVRIGDCEIAGSGLILLHCGRKCWNQRVYQG